MHANEEEQRFRSRWIRWVARIWSAPIILYALLLFGGYGWNRLTTGVFDPNAVRDVSMLEALPPILIFLSALGLLAAWRWARIGALVALGLQSVASAILLVDRPPTDLSARSILPYVFVLVVLIPAVLFYMEGRRAGASTP